MLNFRRVIIMIILLAMLFFSANASCNNTNKFIPGEDEETETTEIPETTEVPETEPVITNLDVTLIDNVNENTLKLRNCTLVLDGKLIIVEDVFDYSNTFILGDIYEITITVNLKPEVKERIELLKENK